MYRLLIVDDEPAIVDGLMQYFQERTELELDLCKAYDADEALETARRMKIDLIISDIRMPGKSGLQLMDDIALLWPSCRIILLTGHGDFDNAYDAIKKQAFSYILKTEGIEPIYDAVAEAVRALTDEARNRDMIEKAWLQQTAAEPLLRKELLEALLHGDDTDEIWGEYHFKGLKLKVDKERPLLLVVGKVDEWDRAFTYSRKLNALYSVQDLFAHHLSSLLIEERTVRENSDLVWFIQPAAGSDTFADEAGNTDWRAIIAYLKGFIETVQNDCRDVLGVSLSFAVCREAVSWNDIRTEFELMKSAIKQLAFYGRSMAVIDLGMPGDLYPWESPAPTASRANRFDKQLAAFESRLKSGDEQGANELASELFRELKPDLVHHYGSGLERYFALLRTMFSHIDDLSFSEEDMPELRVASMPFIDLLAQWEGAESQINELVRTICVKRKEREEKGEFKVVDRIHRYIRDNLGGDLSLARIAETVYFNPSYLSRHYKRLTGVNLSEYINAVKIEAATSMLNDPQLKINEIALKLGFESPSYFTSFFRKMKKMSPQEYKDLNVGRRK